MEFEIIGSGGCVSLPRPLCECEICCEARLKGRPYSRFGCSLFLHDINLLVDTPEDISRAINMSGIREIDNVMYSHADPDHVLGFRVFEQLRLNWFEVSDGKECRNPIKLIAMPHVMEDLNKIQSKHGKYLDYYDSIRNLVSCETVSESTNIGDVKITFLRIDDATIFVFEQKNKKFVYAPCDVKPFPHVEILEKADMLVIGNTIVGESLKGGNVLSEDSFIRNELFSMDEIVSIKSKLNIDKVVITHLEEDWGKSFSDYKELEKSYDGIEFAYDGMKLII